jgi:hypothetical protein
MSKITEDKAKEKIEEKFNSNNKGRRPNRSNRRKGNKPSNKGYESTKGSNDPKWHAMNDTLLQTATAIPWSWSTGVPITVPGATAIRSGKFNLPGICAIRTDSIPGIGDKFSDALNIGARAIYTRLRGQLKSANAYEGSDVMMYMLNCGDIHQMISWLTRAYNTLPLYSYMSTYVPDTLLRMQNIDPDDLHEHATEFRSRINQLIYKASQIWMPTGFPYLARAKWMYEHYYSEGESIKDQIYFFTPGILRKFTYDPERDYAGKLEAFIPIPPYTDDDHLMTVDNLCNYLDDMIEAMINDSDFQNIAGDLYNCFGSSGVETFALIPENGIEYPIMDEEVLEQIHNLRCTSAVARAFADFEDHVDDFSVLQDETDNVLVVHRAFINDINARTAAERTVLSLGFMKDVLDSIITVHKDPSPVKTMNITRMHNVALSYTENAQTNVYNSQIEVAANHVLSIELGIINPDTKNLVVHAFDSNGIKQWDNTIKELGVEHLTYMSNFHYFPLINTTRSTPLLGTYFGEMDIIALLSKVQIQDMNRVDIMSQFAIPEVGKVSNK